MYLTDYFYESWISLKNNFIIIETYTDYKNNDSRKLKKQITSNPKNKLSDTMKVNNDDIKNINEILDFLEKEEKYLEKLSNFQELDIDQIILNTSLKGLIKDFKLLKDIEDIEKEDWLIVNCKYDYFTRIKIFILGQYYEYKNIFI